MEDFFYKTAVTSLLHSIIRDHNTFELSVMKKVLRTKVLQSQRMSVKSPNIKSIRLNDIKIQILVLPYQWPIEIYHAESCCKFSQWARYFSCT